MSNAIKPCGELAITSAFTSSLCAGLKFLFLLGTLSLLQQPCLSAAFKECKTCRLHLSPVSLRSLHTPSVDHPGACCCTDLHWGWMSILGTNSEPLTYHSCGAGTRTSRLAIASATWKGARARLATAFAPEPPALCLLLSLQVNVCCQLFPTSHQFWNRSDTGHCAHEETKDHSADFLSIFSFPVCLGPAVLSPCVIAVFFSLNHCLKRADSCLDPTQCSAAGSLL